ncbi:mannosyl-oligosaccharide alpha-1,2-mannosidase [Coemansia sp. Cherry 401B]|nr:mannosyl-oligosaccharide alpha-1,2-mannosidase [Coemansia sp. Cherry 401B]
MPVHKWAARRRRWLVALAVLAALLFLYAGRRQQQPQQQQQQQRPALAPDKEQPAAVRRRFRTLEQDPALSQWPADLSVDWQASSAQLAELDTIIQAARCGPRCQPASSADWRHRQQQVVRATQLAWAAYARDALGCDEYMPLSHRGRNFTHLGIGYLAADALDTLWLMGLRAEYAQARGFLAHQVTFDQRGAVSLFETTIRVLGGLLSAYHWSGESDTRLLVLADQLGTRLARSFNTSTGIPPETAILRSDGIPFAGDCSTSESATLQLEFRYLAKLTGNLEYRRQADRVIDVMLAAPKFAGLVPTRISATTGLFTGRDISLGSRGDSYYEYMLKQWLQTRRSEPDLRSEYDAAMAGVKKYLVATSPRQNLTYIGELLRVAGEYVQFSAKMDHLVCFLAGNLALGATNGSALADAPPLARRDLDDLALARELGETCAHMYFDTPSGLAPEIAYFRQDARESSDNQLLPDGDIMVPPADRHYLLRPETVESFYLLWKITGEPKWREYGWRVFEAIDKWARVDNSGYASLDDVTQLPPPHRDSVEGFFVAETLKYLYLLFSDHDPVSLSDYVFNTEAHPLPVFSW